MNEAKYTPPPYVITRHDGDGTIIKSAGAKNVTVAWLGTNGTYGEDGCYTILPEESMANALLLSAAPELLEACDYLNMIINSDNELAAEYGNEEWNIAMKKIRNARTKARGE